MISYVLPWVCACREWQIDGVADDVDPVELSRLVREAAETHLRIECRRVR